ncbi:enoyl-CoA hydratase [Erythrobacter arachoides]|uniref:Enoyl-CoA hydratase n=1 Tax=Aurantiacibacter arachoides TaxID=1850444 RepID=A0A845A5Z8_9SPHN|nr:enoyl-CoA hydratase [Aurantiacibacter arachoides]MXO94357.1 enoyl-CoA hydratase [Aurantiacibacter arachoides]GGD64092.1 enoyl-CoA hydratase [Aurantiacibacter arachoides]
MSEQVIVRQDGGVMTLRLNRADKKNALTDAMYGALVSAMERAGQDAAVRSVTITAEGADFCAGNDIGDFLAAGERIGEANVFRFIRLLASFAKPLVAGVQGRAVGIGTTMLLHCDYVVAADDAKLTTPFAALGLVPEAASSVLLPARIGHARAFAMLAMGEAMGAGEAQRLGLVNAVVAPEDLGAAAGSAAQRIAALPPGAIQATKALMRDSAVLGAVMQAEGTVFGERLQSEEAREAFTAFMQKRAPDFSRF